MSVKSVFYVTYYYRFLVQCDLERNHISDCVQFKGLRTMKGIGNKEQKIRISTYQKLVLLHNA